MAANAAQMQADINALQALVAQQQADAATNQATTQAAIANNQAAFMAAIGAINQPVPPPVPGNPAVTPGSVAGVLNVSEGTGYKIHKAASMPLTDKFDGSSDSVIAFVDDLRHRGSNFGWSTELFGVTCADGVTRNILDEHATITMADISAKANVYAGTHPVATRGMQAAAQLASMLRESISAELKSRMIARNTEYTFTVNNHVYEDGLGMLKIIFNLVAVDTRATLQVFLTNLSKVKLSSKLQELGNDLVKFHLFVNEQITGLVRRRQVVPSIVAYLFEAYKEVPDDQFVTWAKEKLSKWEDPDTPDITNEQLMAAAENKYATILQKGEWKVPTLQSQEIIALRAQVEELSSAKKRKLEPVKSTGTSGAGDKGTVQAHRPDLEWKKDPPKAGEPHEKKVKNKEYVYCPHHVEICWVLKSGHIGGCKNAIANAKITKQAPVPPPVEPAKPESVKDQALKALAAIEQDAE